jgi:hypothetical protein
MLLFSWSSVFLIGGIFSSTECEEKNANKGRRKKKKENRGAG